MQPLIFYSNYKISSFFVLHNFITRNEICSEAQALIHVQLTTHCRVLTHLNSSFEQVL